VESEKIKSEYIYLSWLARCYIKNNKARLAWELYLKLEQSTESFSLLQLIADDCYKMGQFYYSARAFDILARADPRSEYCEAKRGACAGAFQLIVAGHEPRETLREILLILRNSQDQQEEMMAKIIKEWARNNKVNV
jgi:intraflagellar transport protein 56